MRFKLDKSVLNAAVLVGALGYFVDIYDLVLFSIVRVPSLRALGVGEDRLLDVGVALLNRQMLGLLLGGILWGVLGDKKGRLSVLFGSIFLYSAANIANAYVTSIEAYGRLRFLAGVGLAGELGAAITLVCEVLPKETRGYGTMIVAGVGLIGGVTAGLVGDLMPWQTAYKVGGALGLLLLLTRIGVYESGLYGAMPAGTRRGDLNMLFNDSERFLKYLRCILVGIPIWYVFGILITFSPEIARSLGVEGTVSVSKAIFASYVGVSLGDFASGYLSQVWRSRKKVVYASLAALALLVPAYLFSSPGTRGVYVFCAVLGFATGYWAVFVTIAAEQFGTNLRATVATTTPNFVRGSTVLLTSAFQALRPSLGIAGGALAVGACCLGVAALALRGLHETYGRDLNYLESP